MEKASLFQSRQVRDARGPVKIRVTVPTTNGWKAIALSAGARQELFISTELKKEELAKWEMTPSPVEFKMYYSH